MYGIGSFACRTEHCMLTIKEERNGSQLKLILEGRLDTKTAPELEEKVKTCLEGVDSLIIDMKDLEYVSSAGLRIILFTKKQMKNKEMVLENVNEGIMEVFEMTGFADILDIR